VDPQALAAAAAAATAAGEPTPVPRTSGRARSRWRWWQVAGGGFAVGGLLVALLLWLMPQATAPPGLQRATASKPVIAIRPLLAQAAFDPQTFAVASRISGRLRASPELRVTSPDAVAALNDPATASVTIMATLESDALIEVLPVRVQPDGYHASVRLLMSGALPVSLPPVGPFADLSGLADALVAALAPHLRLDPEAWHAQPHHGDARGNPEALEHFARGLRHSATESPGGTALACQAFKASIDADPEFAAGYARWAQCLLTQYRFGAVDAATAFDYARTAASMALDRDAHNADARAAVADLFAEATHEWARAEDEFHKALAADSSNVFARSRYAMLLAGRGRTAEAVEQLTDARRSAPLSTVLRGYMAMALHYAGRDDEALALFQQLRSIDTALESPLVGQCRIFVSVGKFEDALSACRDLSARRGGRDAFSQAQIVAALGRSGRHGEADRLLRDLRAQYDAASEQDRPNLAFFLATAYAGLEQVEAVFSWLEVAAAGKSSRLSYFRVDQRFAIVRSDPRWADVLSRYESGL
ncbi:MAG: tetratricopeptide repeat protein, partial [Luteitalea sp.]